MVGGLRSAFSSESGAEDVNRALDSVQTSDPTIVASPGTPPAIPQTGETDPQRMESQVAEGAHQSAEALAQQQQAVSALPGSERVQRLDVHETQPVGELSALAATDAPAPPGAQQYLQMGQPEDVQTAFDEIAAAPMQQSLSEAQAQIDQAAQERDQQHQAEVESAQQQTTEAQRQAETDQRAKVASTSQQIDQQRQSTQEQQRAAVDDVQSQADTRRQTDREQFDERARSDQQQIDDRYAQTEQDANAEIQNGERQAEDERRRAEREAEDQSWWEAALDFITDLFDALVGLINNIFDAVRAAVNALLDAVRDFALGLIALAAGFLTGLIQAFGEFLSGLVVALLGDIFPELAAALVAFIDEAVQFATDAIQAVAEALSAAVNAIVEGLRAGINALLNLYQAAVNAALALARAALTGDWGAFILQLLEAACRVAGIDPQQIYAFIGRAQETIQLIIDDPGQFLSNALDALLGGFQRFADNFLTHLQAGIIGWLTGALGTAGIQLPERFDLMGVISLVAQILGLTWENLRQRIIRFVGERGMQVIEFVAGYVQTLIQGGWSALWERIQNDLSTLRDMVLEGIRSFLVERIIMAAVTRLATMFNPVGALVNILIATYNFYTFIRDQIQRIVQIVTTIVDAIGNIARGVLGPAQERIESFLAGLLPLAIDLLARLLGLGNVGEQVREILQRVQDTIWGAIDRLIERVVGMFRGGAAQPGAEAVAAGAGGAEIGEHITIPLDGQTHTLYIVRNPAGGADPIVATTPMTVAARLADWDQRKTTLSEQPAANQPESPRAKATRLIPAAQQELGQVDQLADSLAQQGVVAPRPAAAAVPAGTAAPAAGGANQGQAQVTREEHQLASVLGQLFQVFGETPAQGGALDQSFSGNIAAAHSEVQRGLQVALTALEGGVPRGQNAAQLFPNWDAVRNALSDPGTFRGGAEGRGFVSFVHRPLNQGTTPLSGNFPQVATDQIAIAGLNEAITRTPPNPPIANFNAAEFVQGQKASLQEQRSPYSRSLLSIRAVIWDARAESAARSTVGDEIYRRLTDPASRPGAGNAEKIARYQQMYQAAGVSAPAPPDDPITDDQVDAYRREMRADIVTRYSRQPVSVTDLNAFLDRNNLFEGGYNRIRGEIFEGWIETVIPGVQGNRPVFSMPDGRRVDGDRIRGDKIVEAKAIVEPRPPQGEEVIQMQDYRIIIRRGLKAMLVNRAGKHVGESPEITGVIYIFNRGVVAAEWISALTSNIGGANVSVLVGNTLYDPFRIYQD